MVTDQALTDEDTIKGNANRITATSPCTATQLIPDLIWQRSLVKNFPEQVPETVSKLIAQRTSAGTVTPHVEKVYESAYSAGHHPV
jgi:hypothetical protein